MCVAALSVELYDCACGEQAVVAPPRHWPLSSEAARLLFLRACCAVAEGADVPLPRIVASPCPADACVAAVLGDALHRVAVLGGRDGMSRSLGSVYGGSVTRFLGGGFRGVVSRVISTPGVSSWCNGVAVSRDGSTLLVSDWDGGSHTIHEFRVADGSLLRTVGGKGRGPLQFDGPRQVWIASDDFVFVADNGNKRVQVLTPRLDFHGFVGVGTPPVSVCANDDVVVVVEQHRQRISVFSRRGGSLLRRFGSLSGDVDTSTPLGLCFMPGDRHIALTDRFNKRVWVLGIDGEFIRHVGMGVLNFPVGVACSAFGELVVADFENQHVALFSVDGELLKTMGSGQFGGVAMHGGTVFAQDYKKRCVVFE